MFESFVYENDKDLFGIRIKNNIINLGNASKINNFLFIRIDTNQIFKGYHVLSFDKFVNKEIIEIMTQLFNFELKTNKHNTIESIIDRCANYFSTQRKNNILREYLGLTAELVFIYKIAQSGIDVSKYYQKNNDLYDFSFPNGCIEIKSIKKESNSIKLNNDQMKHIHEKGNELVCVRLQWDSVKGMDLKQIYNSIDFNNVKHNKLIMDKINDLYIGNREIFDEIKIDINKTEMQLFDKTALPDTYIFDELAKNKSFISATFDFKLIKSFKSIIKIIKEFCGD